MKKIVMTFALMLGYINSNSSIYEQLDTTKIISLIKKHYKESNDSASFFNNRTIVIYDESTEAGQLVAYYNKSKLKRINVSFLGETGKVVYDYFFCEKNIYFSIYTKIQYDRPFREKDRKLMKNEEQRFYFYKNTLIRWIDRRGKLINGSSIEFKQKEKEILQDVNYFFKKIE